MSGYPDDQPTLRVMRLFKPPLSTLNTLPSYEAVFHSGSNINSSNVSSSESLGHSAESDFALGSCLKLPESFGSIYLGESFTAYISVVNSLPQQHIVDVDMKVRLQTPSTKIDLYDKRQERGSGKPLQNPAPLLLSGQRLDMIVDCKLEELGMYALRVTVLYRDANSLPGQEPKTLPKFYRFNVLNPIEISSSCAVPRGVPLVQISIRNATQVDLLLDSYEFNSENESNYISELIGAKTSLKLTDPTIENDISALDCFDKCILLGPNETHQFIYQIKKSIDSSKIEQKEWKLPFGSHTLGHLQLYWRTVMGESGSIRSNPIVCDLVPNGGVQVLLEDLNRTMKLNELRKVTAVITNLTDRTLQLQLQFRSELMAGIFIHGRSFRNLGEVLPFEEKRCDVQFIPLAGGLHSVNGCFVVDMQTTIEYPQDKLGTIFVEW